MAVSAKEQKEDYLPVHSVVNVTIHTVSVLRSLKWFLAKVGDVLSALCVRPVGRQLTLEDSCYVMTVT